MPLEVAHKCFLFVRNMPNQEVGLEQSLVPHSPREITSTAPSKYPEASLSTLTTTKLLPTSLTYVPFLFLIKSVSTAFEDDPYESVKPRCDICLFGLSLLVSLSRAGSYQITSVFIFETLLLLLALSFFFFLHLFYYL